MLVLHRPIEPTVKRERSVIFDAIYPRKRIKCCVDRLRPPPKADIRNCFTEGMLRYVHGVATALLKYPNCGQAIGTKTSFKSSSRVFCRDGSSSRARPTAVSTTGNSANCSLPTRIVHERSDSPEDNHG